MAAPYGGALQGPPEPALPVVAAHNAAGSTFGTAAEAPPPATAHDVPVEFVVGPVASIPPGAVRVVQPEPGHSIGVFNLRGEFFALRNRCPHMDGPLCLGRVAGTSRARRRHDGVPQLEWTREGEFIVCPWHQWEFEIRTGRTAFPSRWRVRRYPVLVRDDTVVLDLGRDRA